MLGGVPCIESTDHPMISPVKLTYGSLIKVVRLTQENIDDEISEILADFGRIA
jgi:hypothetical protein